MKKLILLAAILLSTTSYAIVPCPTPDFIAATAPLVDKVQLLTKNHYTVYTSKPIYDNSSSNRNWQTGNDVRSASAEDALAQARAHIRSVTRVQDKNAVDLGNYFGCFYGNNEAIMVYAISIK